MYITINTLHVFFIGLLQNKIFTIPMNVRYKFTATPTSVFVGISTHQITLIYLTQLEMWQFHLKWLQNSSS